MMRSDSKDGARLFNWQNFVGYTPLNREPVELM